MRRADEEHPSGDPRFGLIDRTLKRFQYQQDALIEVLHTAQEAFGFLSDDLLIYVAHQLKLPPSWVYGVATFYHFFTLKPQGQHNCIVCMGTACYVKRAAEIVAALQKEYTIDAGETTSDGTFSVVTAIMKESTVPSCAPLASSASATGIVPKMSAYIGMPMTVANTTPHGLRLPSTLAIHSSGIQL